MTEKLQIRFFVENEEYGGRFWASIPRVGDEVMLSAGRRYTHAADASGKVPFVVERVVWGVEGPNDRIQCVNIEITPAFDREAN